MKKILGILFAFLMILSVAFIGDAISSNNPFSAQAQTRKGNVTVKRKNNGIATRTARGAKYIYRKGKNGTVYVYRKTAKGVVYVGKKTAKGSKYVAHKTKRGTKKVVSRTKKIVY